MHLLASEWYRCNDIPQLKSYHEHRDGQTSSSARSDDRQTVSEASHVHLYNGLDASGLANTGETSWTAFNEPFQINYGPQPNYADTLAFLFEDTATGSDVNDITKTWLADSWFDWLPTMAGDKQTNFGQT